MVLDVFHVCLVCHSVQKIDERKLIAEALAAEGSGDFTYDPAATPQQADNIDSLTEGTKSEGGLSSVVEQDRGDAAASRHPLKRMEEVPHSSGSTSTVVRDTGPQNHHHPNNNHHVVLNGGAAAGSDSYDVEQMEEDLNNLDFGGEGAHVCPEQDTISTALLIDWFVQ